MSLDCDEDGRVWPLLIAAVLLFTVSWRACAPVESGVGQDARPVVSP